MAHRHGLKRIFAPAAKNTLNFITKTKMNLFFNSEQLDSLIDGLHLLVDHKRDTNEKLDMYKASDLLQVLYTRKNKIK